MYPMVEIYIEDARNFQKHAQYDLAIEALLAAIEVDNQHVLDRKSVV